MDFTTFYKRRRGLFPDKGRFFRYLYISFRSIASFSISKPAVILSQAELARFRNSSFVSLILLALVSFSVIFLIFSF